MLAAVLLAVAVGAAHAGDGAAPVEAATTAVEVIPVGEHAYTVSRALPPEIVGTYRYEEKGEPIVEIRADGTGLFQPHGVPAIPIAIWIHVDDAGTPLREVGTELRYRYTLVVRYGAGGGGNYPEGGYGLLDVTMLKDDGIAVVLGERIRRL